MADLSHQYADDTRSPFLSGHGAVSVLVAELDIETDNLGAGDRWDFFKVPDDAIIKDVYLYTDDLDSDGTPTLALDVKTEDEDGNAGVTIISADTTAQSGGWVQGTSNVPVITDAADYFVFVEVNTAAATAQAGSAKLVVEYFRTRV